MSNNDRYHLKAKNLDNAERLTLKKLLSKWVTFANSAS